MSRAPSSANFTVTYIWEQHVDTLGRTHSSYIYVYHSYLACVLYSPLLAFPLVSCLRQQDAHFIGARHVNCIYG
jgi:hypothetical protein